MPMTRSIPLTVARVGADDRPVYEVRGASGDVLATIKGQTALRDALLGLERRCAPVRAGRAAGDHLARRAGGRGAVVGLARAPQAASVNERGVPRGRRAARLV
jgi:hypothetical protein